MYCEVTSAGSDSVTPQTIVHQVPLSIWFSRQEYCSRLPCPPPGYLLDPGIEPTLSHVSCNGRQVLYHIVFVIQSYPTLLRPHGLQHTRLPCPSPIPGACSNSWPLTWWCYKTISPSVVPFSSGLQSFPASEAFLMSWLFTSGGLRVLELQLQHQSFQWIFRTDFL